MTQNSISAEPQLIDKILSHPFSNSVILVIFAAAVASALPTISSQNNTPEDSIVAEANTPTPP